MSLLRGWLRIPVAVLTTPCEHGAFAVSGAPWASPACVRRRAHGRRRGRASCAPRPARPLPHGVALAPGRQHKLDRGALGEGGRPEAGVGPVEHRPWKQASGRRSETRLSPRAGPRGRARDPSRAYANFRASVPELARSRSMTIRGASPAQLRMQTSATTAPSAALSGGCADARALERM
jgi:hypothetical protein